MNYPKFPSYYFEFTLESNEKEAHLINLEWISKKMGYRPSSVRLKEEKISIVHQVQEAKFTQ